MPFAARRMKSGDSRSIVLAIWLSHTSSHNLLRDDMRWDEPASIGSISKIVVFYNLLRSIYADMRCYEKKRVGGWGGIRTHEELAPLPVFKTGAFNRSATHPVKIQIRGGSEGGKDRPPPVLPRPVEPASFLTYRLALRGLTHGHAGCRATGGDCLRVRRVC